MVKLAWRSDVEGLRALAVLMVVTFHAGGLGGGFAGVDVFFVISGFLMTSLLGRELAETGKLSVPRFYARRAVRLLPASAVVITATLVAAWAWLPAGRFSGAVADALSATFYAMNLRLAAQGGDYLAATAQSSPFMHFWSLAVEEQFYLLWPLVMLLFARRLIAALAVIGAASFAFSVWQTIHDAPSAYFGLPTRMWELVAGALVAVTASQWAKLTKPVAIALRWLGLASIATAALLLNSQTPFPGYAAALPVLATAMVIGAGCAHPESRVLGSGPMRWLGRLSYSWYLWHWPVVFFAALRFGPLSPAIALACGAFSLALAALTYVAVENPLRSRASLRLSPVRGLGLGLGLCAAVGVFAVALPAPGARLELPAVEALELGADAERTLAAALAESTPHSPANLVPALSTATSDYARIYPDGCSSAFTDVTVRKPCLYGDADSATTVVLFGDSHAGQWFPALEQIAVRRGWRLAVVIKSACTAAWVLVHQPRLKRPYHECVRWRESAIAHIRALNPALVVMSGADDGTATDLAQRRDEGWASAWRATFARLASPGTRQILILDTPWPSADVPACVAKHPSRVASCGRGVQEAVAEPGRRKLIAASAAAASVTVVDPVRWLCTETRCPVIVGNVLMYYDASHLSATYARLLAPLVAHHLG